MPESPFLRSTARTTFSPAPRPLWTPQALFFGGFGAWYDPSDLSTLFQDSAATTPVTADNQPVGCMRDKSGNGVHLLQATSGARPTWRAGGNGAAPYLSFDGTDDWLLAMFSDQATMGFAAVSGLATDTSTTRVAMQVSATTLADSFYQAFVNTTPLVVSQIRGLASAVRAQSTGAVGTAGNTASAKLVSTDLATYVDGGSAATATNAWPEANLTKISLGANTSGAFFWQGRLYGAVMVQRTLSATEIARAQEYMRRRYAA